jgi:hypothetical protein
MGLSSTKTKKVCLVNFPSCPHSLKMVKVYKLSFPNIFSRAEFGLSTKLANFNSIRLTSNLIWSTLSLTILTMFSASRITSLSSSHHKKKYLLLALNKIRQLYKCKP